MPLIASKYRKPWYLWNAHVETIYPSMYRKVALNITPERERIYTKDGDFLDLDWYFKEREKLVVISHGLEGNSQRPYVLGMVKIFTEAGYGALAWNCRGCSGDINYLPRFYHHGAIEDLEEVIIHAVFTNPYKEIHLIGLSLGGALGANYLSKKSKNEIPVEVKSQVGISVPFNIKSSAAALENGFSTFYRDRFLKKIKAKAERKVNIYPDIFSQEMIDSCPDFETFDNYFTAPLHGFRDAEEFYHHASAIHFIENLQHPSLFISAQNDPMLPDDCYPLYQAKKQSNLFLEIPKHGGHVGFLQKEKPYSYVEERALEFVLMHQS